jgi:hypothetical protein
VAAVADFGGEWDPVLTGPEAAALLKIAPRTLQDWRTDGKGPPYFLINGRPRYLLSAVRGYVAECMAQPTEGREKAQDARAPLARSDTEPLSTH